MSRYHATKSTVEVRIFLLFMQLKSLILLLLSNSITSRRDKSILYSRVAISILLLSTLITYDNLSLLFLAKGIGIFSGLFHTTATTNTFHIFIFLITIQLIDQLKGYYYINPVLSLSLAITLFSFAGIPPLIGFFGKQMILSAAIDNGYIFMSLVAILTSVISAVYYLTIIKQIFFDKNDYRLNEKLEGFQADGLIDEENSMVEKVNIKMNNIVISSSLSLSISVITLIITLFIFIPKELLTLANILALVLFNL